MRSVRLTGREASVVRAIGFTEGMVGSEIIEHTRMEPEDVADTLNSLMSAGFVETVPYYEQIQLEQIPVTTFEMNPGYVQDIRTALQRR
ncbi:MAG: helix-turn-helix domain-containing protein [Chthoniobacterales bacterium]